MELSKVLRNDSPLLPFVIGSHVGRCDIRGENKTLMYRGADELY